MAKTMMQHVLDRNKNHIKVYLVIGYISYLFKEVCVRRVWNIPVGKYSLTSEMGLNVDVTAEYN